MMKFLGENNPKLVAVIMKFRSRACSFNKTYLFQPSTIKNVSSSTWWQNVDPSGSELETDTMNIITNLLTSVASSASVERIFSTFGFVHSAVRNRLGVEKAGKLVFLFRNLNNC